MAKMAEFPTWENMGANVGARSYPATSRNVGAGTPPPYGGVYSSHVRGSGGGEKLRSRKNAEKFSSQVRRAA